MPTVLEAAGLTRRFGSFTALDDLNLTIDAGEIVCLLGANGAGKTTTLNLFLGFLRPSAGTVRVAGWDPVSQAAEARAVLGYVPETVALYPRLSGIENLAFFNDLNGEHRADPGRAAGRTRPGRALGGRRQRVAPRRTPRGCARRSAWPWRS